MLTQEQQELLHDIASILAGVVFVLELDRPPTERELEVMRVCRDKLKELRDNIR